MSKTLEYVTIHEVGYESDDIFEYAFLNRDEMSIKTGLFIMFKSV